MNNGSFPDRDAIDEKWGGKRRTREEREDAEEEGQFWGGERETLLRWNHFLLEMRRSLG